MNREARGVKKCILLWMCVFLCLLAAGCSKTADTGESGAADASATQAPADGSPTLPPDEEVADAIAPADYQYQALASEGGGLTLEYPSQWSRIPGTNTVCFVEPIAESDGPARFTLTKKTLDSTPNADQRKSQLAAFLKRVVADYSSYEYSPVSTDGSFMGDKGAYYITYTVQKDGLTLKGYIIMATKGKDLYAFHFRSNVNTYESFNSVMTRIRDSITVK
jgi:hypothetical protein